MDLRLVDDLDIDVMREGWKVDREVLVAASCVFSNCVGALKLVSNTSRVFCEISGRKKGRDRDKYKIATGVAGERGAGFFLLLSAVRGS